LVLEAVRVRSAAGSVSKSVSESNLPIPDIGPSAQGKRVRWVAVSLNAGLDVKGLDMAKPKKTVAKAKEFAFEKGDFVVYPTHGVGRVIDIEAKEIAGHKLDLFVISFEQERMMLRVPVAKAKISGLRKLSSRKIMENALVTLKGRSRVSRAMWNRRAQEYEAKINSGDPVSIAEVVRDLHRNAGQPDQSYSERQIYEAALDRLARELAAVERIDKDLATQKLNSVLQKVA
jgi:CarD family transcriptional regulator